LLYDYDIFQIYLNSNSKVITIKPNISVIDKNEHKKIKRNPSNFYYKKYTSDDIWLGEGMHKSV
jgi:hypothetical protein